MGTALVWGVTGGIGKAVAAELLRRGWVVLGTTRSTMAPDMAGVHLLTADVADPLSVRQAVFNAAQEVEQLDLLVYAAGDIVAAPIGEMAPEDFGRMISTNLTGAYLAVHHSLPLLAPDAPIVLIGAIQERLRLPGLSAYAAAKAGLEAFAEALGKEERKRRVLLVRPGAVDTPLWQKVPLKLPPNALEADEVAIRLFKAVEAGEKGVLDLT